MPSRIIIVLLMALTICLTLASAQAQQTAITYQGKLSDNGSPANGNYDLQFDLWDTTTNGNEVSPLKTLLNVPVNNGLFTVTVDFGAGIFNGGVKYLQIAARPSGTGPYTILSPRQPITSTPYAVRSLNTATADLATNANKLAGVDANQYVQTADARLSDARPPTAGSGNYIQNSSSPQADSNFAISGDGKAGGTLSANLVNALTQYNLNGNRAFAISGSNVSPNTNTFVGVGAGALTTPIPYPGFGGTGNSFFGSGAGAANTTGVANSFFGQNAGKANTTGIHNSFFGNQAGFNNTTGEENSFFGDWAGVANTTGYLNSFFGHRAGWHNTEGSFNVIVGYDTGQSNTTGNWNSFFGTAAGWSNTTGSGNTYLGNLANGSADLNNATAIGTRAIVTQSNSLVLGSINGVGGGVDTKVGLGITAPAYKLHVIDPANTGLRVQTDTSGGTVGSFGGFGDFIIDAPGVVGGRFTVKENGNVGIGTGAPDAKLHVAGRIRFASLGEAGIAQLCRNSLGEIASCSSSRRYKTDFRPFTSGLNLINRLQPLTFKWKANQSADLGLGAEDVAAVEPLLVTHNEQGQVEGVKYDRVAVVLINAVKEQQAQIERQQAEIKALKQLVCSSRRKARVCR